MKQYIVLFVLGMIGLALHIFVDLGKLNKQNKGVVNFKQYFLLERFSIGISFLVVVSILFLSQEVKQIQLIGNWFGTVTFSAGYIGQSMLSAVMGKAQQVVIQITNTTPEAQEEVK